MELMYEVRFVDGKVGRRTGVAPTRIAIDVYEPEDSLQVAREIESRLRGHLRRARLLASKLVDVDAEVTGTGGSGEVYAGGRTVARFQLERKGQS